MNQIGAVAWFGPDGAEIPNVGESVSERIGLEYVFEIIEISLCFQENDRSFRRQRGFDIERPDYKRLWRIRLLWTFRQWRDSKRFVASDRLR